MAPQSLPGLTTLLLLLLTHPLVHVVTAHMSIQSPPPLGSSFNPNMAPADIDHNLRSPLSPSGSEYPCGPNFNMYALTPQGNPVATWSAGSTQSFTLDGGATHNGGSCQASLSIDQGKTFKVLKSYEGGCPLSNSYQFNIPADVSATKKAVFAWTWFNQVGNREMYMNCAVVDIVGGSGGGKGGWAIKPEIFKANVGNGCRTVEMFDVRFPNPGEDVQKGGEGKFAAPVGDCGTTVNRDSGGKSGGGGDNSDGSGGSNNNSSNSGNTNGGSGAQPGDPSSSSSSSSSTDTGSSTTSQSTSGDKSESSYVPSIGDWKPGREFPDWFNKHSAGALSYNLSSSIYRHLFMALVVSFIFHINAYFSA